VTGLDEAALRGELIGGDPGTQGHGGQGNSRLWTSVTVVDSTGSTNADLVAAGGPEGQVLVAEEQTAGRGRLGRSWASRPGASLLFSVLVRPDSIPPGRRSWLPLLAGVAVATAVRSVSGLPATLKWPNDLLIDHRKFTGILAEQTGDAVVIGIGINVANQADELPAGPGGLPPTSLLAEGADVSRQELLVEILRQFERHYLPFKANPDPVATGLAAEYENLCATLGRRVRVELPAGRTLTGEATGIDADGRLLVTSDGGVTPGSVTPVSAGDVVHVR
jgi:BirA family biotin operon repressor/biotin-[acetyl-CoA-carboxylase] ligase